MLEKAEDEADKTMDPKLKKKSDELFRKLQTISNKLESDQEIYVTSEEYEEKS